VARSSRILLVDLLHSDGGSLDEDVRSITQALAVHYQVEYLRFDERMGYRAIVGVFRRVLTLRYAKVVFLSSKVGQLFFLAPLRLVAKCYVIYHFMPRHRQNFHERALRVLSRFLVIAVYASGVADRLQPSLGYRPTVLPSRIVERARGLTRLREKLAQKQLRILVPGVRPGVRKQLELAPIIEMLEHRLGYALEGIYIQSGEIPDEPLVRQLVRKVGKLPQAEYDQLYNSALIVAVQFHEDYEVRASGVILDALRSGSIVLSNDHPIIRQYGFPHSIVTDLAHLGAVLAVLDKGSDAEALALIPGADFEEFRARWHSFLS
jgi:hypothetical protein